MAKLYFKYGAMGCSKSAQALITKFNYEERGMTVLLMKPAIDDREDAAVVHSRIGLEAPCLMVPADMDLFKLYTERIYVITTNAEIDYFIDNSKYLAKNLLILFYSLIFAPI